MCPGDAIAGLDGEREGVMGFSAAEGESGGLNFLRFEGVTGAEEAAEDDDGVEVLEAILRAMDSSLTRKIPAGLRSRQRP